MANSSKDLQLRELKDMITELRNMIKTLQATVDAASKLSLSHLLMVHVMCCLLFADPIRAFPAVVNDYTVNNCAIFSPLRCFFCSRWKHGSTIWNKATV